MINPGTYRAKCTEIQWGGDDEKPFVCLTFHLIDINKTLSWFGYFYGSDQERRKKNIERTLESIAYCGWPKGKQLHELSAGDLGSLVDVVVDIETYDGKKQSRIKWVNRPGSGGLTLEKPLDERGKQALSAKLAGFVAKVKHVDPIAVPEPDPSKAEISQPAPANDETGGFFDDAPHPGDG